MECLSLPEDGSKLRSSKSETSLTESFIVVGSDGEEIDQSRHQTLRHGIMNIFYIYVIISVKFHLKVVLQKLYTLSLILTISKDSSTGTLLKRLG